MTGLYGQYQNAQYQNKVNEQQAANTMVAYRDNVAQTNLMQTQEQAAASQKLDENNKAAASAMARASTSAGESGISGLSVDALLADLGGQRDRYNQAVEQNYDAASQAINSQRQNARTNAASQINSLRTPQAPDYLGAALRIGTAVYDYKNPRVNTR